MPTASIRNYQPEDKAALYNVCLRTGDHGGDGEPFFRVDPDALARIYVGPYLEFEPALALVLEDESGISGYALAAFDTREFYDRFEQQWRPDLCKEFTAPTGDANSWSRVEQVYHTYHHPEYFYPEPYENYPSHLHIDLLARTQGQGHGRCLIEKLLQRLRRRGSPGVHLGLGAKNKRALGFYVALGFQELTRCGIGEDESIYMGMSFR